MITGYFQLICTRLQAESDLEQKRQLSIMLRCSVKDNRSNKQVSMSVSRQPACLSIRHYTQSSWPEREREGEEREVGRGEDFLCHNRYSYLVVSV